MSLEAKNNEIESSYLFYYFKIFSRVYFIRSNSSPGILLFPVEDVTQFFPFSCSIGFKFSPKPNLSEVDVKIKVSPPVPKKIGSQITVFTRSKKTLVSLQHQASRPKFYFIT